MESTFTSPAATITAAYNAVNPDTVLAPDDPRYVDFTQWRGDESMADRLTRDIFRSNQSEPISFVKQIVAGHRGSGKSTELLRLQASLEDKGFFVVYFDSALELDMNDVHYSDVLIATMLALAREVQKSGLGLTFPERSVNQLRDRLAAGTMEQTSAVSGSAEAVSSAEVGAGIFGFVKLLSKLTLSLKGTTEQKKQVRRTIEAQTALFLEDLNDLIDNLQIQLRAKDKLGLVLIVDALDRIVLNPLEGIKGRTTHTEVFIEHSAHLKEPRCHIVYTVPISLYFDQNLATSYPSLPMLLRMVKVKERGGAPCNDALGAMEASVTQRIDIDAVFETPSDVRQLCEMSGGHLRDLMLLLREACGYSDERITSRAVDRAIEALTSQYGRLVRDADLDKLVEVHREKRLLTDSEYNHLPYHLLVLEYRNGEDWADVHPAVQRTRPFRQAWEKASGLANANG